MVWVKLDDKFHSNEKVLDAGHAAAGLYAMSLSYCGDHLTDGRVPDAWANQHPKTLRDKLVKNALWKKVKGGYLIPDFNELNPTKAAVETKRSKQRAGGLKGAANRWKPDRVIAQPKGQPMGSPKPKPNAPTRSTRSLDQVLVPTAEEKTPEYVCPRPWCALVFQTARRLDEHIENVHWNEAPQTTHPPEVTR